MEGNGNSVDRWWTLLHYAVMAPSGHNTQPWLFRLRGDSADLFADRSRALPVVDPQGRELVMSCGAALLNLRIAVHHFGLTERTVLFPDPEQPDLLATIQLEGEGAANPAEESLFEAINSRRTNRLPFEPEPLPPDLIPRIEEAARSEGAWLVPLRAETDRRRVADLVAEGDVIQAEDPELRREIAQWVRSNKSDKRDGLRGYSFGHGRFTSLVAPLYIRFMNWGEGQAQADHELASQAPAVAVIGTDGDSPLDWMRAGQALGRVLLLAEAEGVAASFFNQPVEVPELRDRLRALVAGSGYPQLCFRLGRARPVLPTPRRPLEEIVIP